MSSIKTGFFIEHLAISGPGKKDAEVKFQDGLNVIAGPSDTGKSYVLQCIDFAFGAGTPPESIREAAGYETICLKIQLRESQKSIVIRRQLSGGDVEIGELDKMGGEINSRIVSAKHNPKSNDTISGFLLSASGFHNRNVFSKASGTMRSLSFRDLAFMTLVEETRIFSKYPPHISGQHTRATVESSVLKMLVTGTDPIKPMMAATVLSPENATAQLEVVNQIIKSMKLKLHEIGSKHEITAELQRIEQARQALLKEYEKARLNISDFETKIESCARDIQTMDSRTLVVENLRNRFELLHQHYKTDISRLENILETGTILEALNKSSCPVCGASAESQHNCDVSKNFSVPDAKAAASAEIAKITILSRDLTVLLQDLESEHKALLSKKTTLQHSIAIMTARLDNEFTPHVQISAQTLESQTARRDMLLRGMSLYEELLELQQRAGTLESLASKKPSKEVKVSVKPSVSDLGAFTKTVESVLDSWQFPYKKPLLFSETNQDFMLDDQPRVSHGKGVRAITCSAFITGLLSHCLSNKLPHPSFVVLDSPLLVYRPPNQMPDNTIETAEEHQLKKSGFKERFYHSLAQNTFGGQIIVLENQDPPTDLISANICSFTKLDNHGRYGLFPTIK